MGTRKNHKSKKSNKIFRKTRSKKQRGGADECPICTEALNDNCITTECGHKFDRECIIRWCKTSPNDTKCPICREPISNTCMELNPSLFWASKNGRTEIVAELLEKGVSDRAKNTALQWASRNGHTEIVAMLLEKGADVNAKNIIGYTALIWASEYRHTEIVAMLLAAGADVNAKNNDGYTALIEASNKGHTEIVRMLLENGADVNAKDNLEGYNALQRASERGYIETVEMLLEKGADINAKDKYGRTALIEASLMGQTETVAMLLEKGADVNAKNKYGETALQTASVLSARYHDQRARPYADIVKLIKQHIVAQTIPKHLERQEDRENLAMVMSEKDVGNRGDGTMPYDLRHKIGEYLGGGKRKTRKNSFKKTERRC